MVLLLFERRLLKFSLLAIDELRVDGKNHLHRTSASATSTVRQRLFLVVLSFAVLIIVFFLAFLISNERDRFAGLVVNDASAGLAFSKTTTRLCGILTFEAAAVTLTRRLRRRVSKVNYSKKQPQLTCKSWALEEDRCYPHADQHHTQSSAADKTCRPGMASFPHLHRVAQSDYLMQP